MKTIAIANWVLISIYTLFTIYVLFDSRNSQTDAAGRGLVMVYTAFLIGYLILIALLNLINKDWVKILVFIMALGPILYFTMNRITVAQNQSRLRQQAENPNFFQDQNLNELVKLIRKSDYDGITHLLATENLDLNEPGLVHSSLLDMAFKREGYDLNEEEEQLIILLLKNGADPNHPSTANRPTLFKFSEHMSARIFKALLDAGADPNGKNEYGVPVIYEIIDRRQANEKYKKVELLLESGVNPNVKPGNEGFLLNWSCLTQAASQQDWALCELLLNYGADINFKPENGTDFWGYLAHHRQNYLTSGEVPEAFAKLLEFPAIKAVGL